MTSNQPKVLGGTAIRPKERHGWEKIQYLLYNKETGEVLTRTPKSWLLIFIFYVIYYSCLAAFWTAMLFIFFQTLEDGKPKWVGDNGIIGSSPGLGMRPLQSAKNIDSSMVAFITTVESASEESEYEGWGPWAERSAEFLDTYKNVSANAINCNFDEPSTADNPCKFDMSLLGACNKEGYGYSEGKPCIFLKLNRIYGVQNEYYNDHQDTPDDMPQGLKDHIEAQPNKDMVWVDCQPEYPADKEVVTELKYFPEYRGFPSYYFPYMNQKGYQSPIVAVQIDISKSGQLVHFECRAWAKNIGYSKRDRLGIVHFEVMLRS